MSKEFGVLVIDAGPGGHTTAVRAGQLGLSVACCEGSPYDDPKDEPHLDDTYLNVGYIPSEALLISSKEFENVNHHLVDHGIMVGGVKVDVAEMLKRKDDTAGKMTKDVEFLLRKNKVTLFKGYGKFVGKTDVSYQAEVAGKADTKVVAARRVIITTGLRARHLPGVKVDNVATTNNEDALKFAGVPKRLGVAGADVIGLELDSVWHRLDTEATIPEALPNLLSTMDESAVKEANKLLTRQGLKVNAGAKVGEIELSAEGVKVSHIDAAGAAQVLECDKLIVLVGRVLSADNLGPEAIGLAANQCGFIEVGDHYATKLSNLWVIGDVVRGPMLAYRVEDEDAIVAERIVGRKPYVDYNCIPWVTYTYPEIAQVGKIEQRPKAGGRKTRAGQLPFLANDRALDMGVFDDSVKTTADVKTGEILDVHTVAASASDLAVGTAVAMEFKVVAEDTGRTRHPHPSMPGVMREVALIVDKRQFNM